MRSSGLTATIWLTALVPLVSGCGLMSGGRWQPVVATSTPDGATLVVGQGTEPRKTPTSLFLERKRAYTLTFSLPGYTPQDVRLTRSVRQGTLAADLLLAPFSFFSSFVVDLATGALYKLSPEVAHVTLVKADAGPGPPTATVAIEVKSEKDGRADRVGIDSSVSGVAVVVK